MAGMATCGRCHSARHEIARKFRSLDCFSALHASLPRAGLRSSGKGANRTILDCVFHLFLAGTSGRSAAAGVAGAGSLSGPFALMRCQGWFHRLQMRKGLES